MAQKWRRGIALQNDSIGLERFGALEPRKAVMIPLCPTTEIEISAIVW